MNHVEKKSPAEKKTSCGKKSHVKINRSCVEISREINHVKKNSRKNKCIVGKKNVEKNVHVEINGEKSITYEGNHTGKKSRRNKWIVENKSDVVKKKN